MILTFLERSHDVKKSKFTEQQIPLALKQAELGRLGSTDGSILID
ncbi:MAG: hypothetical protein K0S36_2044 [Nitrosospira multiformis]|jgi:putative transposase|nr:hypothetical protein [Nitrosospira multiformis]